MDVKLSRRNFLCRTSNAIASLPLSSHCISTKGLVNSLQSATKTILGISSAQGLSNIDSAWKRVSNHLSRGNIGKTFGLSSTEHFNLRGSYFISLALQGVCGETFDQRSSLLKIVFNSTCHTTELSTGEKLIDAVRAETLNRISGTKSNLTRTVDESQLITRCVNSTMQLMEQEGVIGGNVPKVRFAPESYTINLFSLLRSLGSFDDFIQPKEGRIFPQATLWQHLENAQNGEIKATLGSSMFQVHAALGEFLDICIFPPALSERIQRLERILPKTHDAIYSNECRSLKLPKGFIEQLRAAQEEVSWSYSPAITTASLPRSALVFPNHWKLASKDGELKIRVNKGTYQLLKHPALATTKIDLGKVIVSSSGVQLDRKAYARSSNE